MPTIKLKTDRISGIDVEIHISPSGTFQVLSKDGGLLGSAGSMDEAIRKARPKVAQLKVKLAIPFITKDGERGIATGIHARNRTVLVRMEDKRTPVRADQLSYGIVFRGDTPDDQVQRYLALTSQISEAEGEQAGIEKKYGIELRKTVEHAVRTKAEESMTAEKTD